LEELKGKLGEELLELTQQMVYREGGKEEVLQKLRDVRFCGYKVDCHNWPSYLLPNFKMYNVLVLMLGLCSQMVATFRELIENIQDPFMRFAEFSLRASIYRNIVLTIEVLLPLYQEKFDFLLSGYNEFYNICFRPWGDYPAFNFWRPALSIWVQTMKVFHPQNEKAYNYITSKLRESNLKEFLIAKTEKLPSFFTELKREIDLETFSGRRKEQFYGFNEQRIEMEVYFEDNLEMYETLAKDYIEYMVDILVNEYSVHWCGHSEHAIGHYPLFGKFLSNVVDETA
jgi:hypothetical protein